MSNKLRGIKLNYSLMFLLSGLLVLSSLAIQAAVQESDSGLSQLDFRKVVKDAKAKVFPTVVFIRCLREGMEGGEAKAQSVAGSGVLISTNGEILSNWHVVERAKEV